MTISLGSAVLCAGQARSATGSPVGPSGLAVEIAPGVEAREFVGADRVQPEHVRCDHGVVSFGVTRTFPSVAAALAWIAGPFVSEASEGELKFDGARVFGPKSAVTSRRCSHVGCTVAVTYTIEG
ncbi:MAG: hypothetical protein ACI4RA_05540 [Kiritimatiellia bacterium]